MSLEELFHEKIKKLNETLWDNKATFRKINLWLDNFKIQDEKTHALFILSNCIYFNKIQINTLLQSMYRDFFKYPIIEKIRIENKNTLDINFIERTFSEILNKTRFVAVGNPSESSSHLMMYFRQVNNLDKNLFISPELIEDQVDVENFVFIDDICGSGSQMVNYTKSNVEKIKSMFPQSKVHCFLLLATTHGKEYIKDSTKIDIIDSVLELDNSFKLFDTESRVFKNKPDKIDIDFTYDFISKYGQNIMNSLYEKKYNDVKDFEEIYELSKRDKFGYNDGQYLISFEHNTPDNTLPIIWASDLDFVWIPIFKRLNK